MTDTDPSALFGAIGTAIGALLGLAVAFGAPLTDAQQDAILAAWAALAPLLTALAIRRYAWSPANHRANVAEEVGHALADHARIVSDRPPDSR